MFDRRLQDRIVFHLNRFPFLLRILTWMYKMFLKNMVESSRAKAFNRNALKILKDFTKCLDDNNVFYTLAFGSMLGAVREKGFIKHDADIDVYMWIEDHSPLLNNVLCKSGFKLHHTYSIMDGKLALEETFEKEGILIDIFYIYPAVDKLPYCCDFIYQEDCQNFDIAINKYGGVLGRRFELPFIKERILTQFEDTYLYIPSNSNELLSLRYGPDYMIPNKHWINSREHKNIVLWRDYLAVRTDY